MCIHSGSNPPLKEDNPSLYKFLSRDAMTNSKFLYDLDKDEMREFQHFIVMNSQIRTMTTSEVDEWLRAKYIKKLKNMIEAVYSGEVMELRLIAALGASEPLPSIPDMDPTPECDDLMASMTGLMASIPKTIQPRFENLGDFIDF